MAQGQNVPDITEQMFLTIGLGAIDPNPRVRRGEIDEALLADISDRLQTDEFYDLIDPKAIPRVCVDGRGFEIGPCAAGGTFSLIMADALTTRNYLRDGDTAPDHARRMYGEFQALGHKIGGHGDEHASGANCGCAACDKLDAVDKDQPSILRRIAEDGDAIAAVVASLGVPVSEGQKKLIETNAAGLRDSGYAVGGKVLRDVVVEAAGEASAPVLPGQHLEAFLVIQKRPGMTLNRRRLYEATDGKLQAFVLDVSNLVEGCKLLAVNEHEANDRLVGALFYNVATASTIAGPGLRLVEHL